MLSFTNIQQHYNEDENGCWNWNKAKFADGYGRYGDARAHRLVYRLYYGNFKASLLVCHTCDNTNCINPAHLFLGTQKDNMQDMNKKGRSGKTILTARKVCLIKGLLRSIKAKTSANLTNTLVAKLFDVNRSTIADINLNRTWTHIV